MKDKRIFFTLMAAATISGFIVICTLGQATQHRRAAAKHAEIARSLPEVKFVVREYEGRIGVFRGDCSVPYRVSGCELSLISDYDRQMLAEGISFRTEDELNEYLNDLTT